MRILISFLVLALAFAPAPAAAQRADEVWTARIFDVFSSASYTWRLKPSGRYTEDGHDLDTGVAVQDTLRGTWTRTGARLVLKQDSLGYVFDGTVDGGRYSGTLFQFGEKVSRFCAWKGTAVPTSCDSDLVS